MGNYRELGMVKSLHLDTLLIESTRKLRNPLAWLQLSNYHALECSSLNQRDTQTSPRTAAMHFPSVFVVRHQGKDGKYKRKNICSLNSFEKYSCKNKCGSSISYSRWKCNMFNLGGGGCKQGTKEYGNTTFSPYCILLPIGSHANKRCKALPFICVDYPKRIPSNYS